ncbi:hypothetical protein [Bacillus sp. FSL P2-0092]|uniref:hypothetical protein n=1 Tax=Bacillus sp. FSL P2-0092 TaxID=2921571 RepID=UPI0030FBC35A
MREIKTETQTLDLSKKVTVEVSLAELVMLAACAYGVQDSYLHERLTCHWKDDFGHLMGSLVHRVVIAGDIDEILALHGVKEDK